MALSDNDVEQNKELHNILKQSIKKRNRLTTIYCMSEQFVE